MNHLVWKPLKAAVKNLLISSYPASIYYNQVVRNPIYALIFILLFSGCFQKQPPDKSSLVREDELIFAIGNESSNASAPFDHFLKDDTAYLAIWNKNLRQIELYNLKTSTFFGSILIADEGPKSFSGVDGLIVKSYDSIIIINNNKEIGIVDRNGSILKRLQFRVDNLGRKVQGADYYLDFTSYIVGDELFLSQEYRIQGVEAVSIDFLNKAYVNVTVDLMDGECIQSPLTYPESFAGKDITGVDVLRVYGFKGQHVYHFSPFKTLFITYDHKRFIQIPIETKYQLDFPDKNWEILSKGFAGYYSYYAQHDQVMRFVYDKYRNCYFLAIRIKENLSEKEMGNATMRWRFPHCLIIALDKDFKTIAEVTLPDNTYSCMMMFVAPEGLYISEDNPNNPLFDENYRRFCLFVLKKQPS